jgi:hypothetical protein
VISFFAGLAAGASLTFGWLAWSGARAARREAERVTGPVGRSYTETEPRPIDDGSYQLTEEYRARPRFGWGAAMDPGTPGGEWARRGENGQSR